MPARHRAAPRPWDTPRRIPGEQRDHGRRCGARDAGGEAATVRIDKLYTLLICRTSIRLCHVLAELVAPEFGPGPESLEVALYEENDVPWIAWRFPLGADTAAYFAIVDADGFRCIRRHRSRPVPSAPSTAHAESVVTSRDPSGVLRKHLKGPSAQGGSSGADPLHVATEGAVVESDAHGRPRTPKMNAIASCKPSKPSSV